jgi:predicted nucleic acid-binding protein
MPLELVVDANVLFAALLAKSVTRALIFNSQLKLHAPEFLLGELKEHLEEDEEMKEKLKQTKEETEIVVHELLHQIEIIPISEYQSHIKKAIEISPDEFDAPYFAVALHLNIPIWSNERKLKEKQKIIQVLKTHEILKMFSQQD